MNVSSTTNPDSEPERGPFGQMVYDNFVIHVYDDLRVQQGCTQCLRQNCEVYDNFVAHMYDDFLAHSSWERSPCAEHSLNNSRGDYKVGRNSDAVFL